MRTLAALRWRRSGPLLASIHDLLLRRRSALGWRALPRRPVDARRLAQGGRVPRRPARAVRLRPHRSRPESARRRLPNGVAAARRVARRRAPARRLPPIGFDDRDVVANEVGAQRRRPLPRRRARGWRRAAATNRLKFDNAPYFRALMNLGVPRKWDGPLQYTDAKTETLIAAADRRAALKRARVFAPGARAYAATRSGRLPRPRPPWTAARRQPRARRLAGRRPLSKRRRGRRRALGGWASDRHVVAERIAVAGLAEGRRGAGGGVRVAAASSRRHPARRQDGPGEAAARGKAAWRSSRRARAARGGGRTAASLRSPRRGETSRATRRGLARAASADARIVRRGASRPRARAAHAPRRSRAGETPPRAASSPGARQAPT